MSPALKEIFQTQLTNAYDKLNLTNTTAQETIVDRFRDIINKVYVEVDSGIYDYNKALRKAMRELSKTGITGATYLQKDGSIIHYPLDSAIRRNLFTSAAKTATEMQLKRADEWGSELVEISSHIGARPNCAPYQGRIYSLKRGHLTYSCFYDTSYGQPDGIMGINCGHSVYPFFEGISEQTYFPYDEGENARVYEESQKQRRLEVEVRDKKRELLIANQNNDTKSFKQLSIQLKTKEAKLRDYKDETGRQQQSRIWAVGFDRSISQKAVWADRKSLFRQTENVIIGLKYKDVEITSISYHNVERMKERGISPEDMRSAILKPIFVKDIRVEKNGNKSQELTGENAVVVINPDTGKIITTWKTSSKIRDKYKRGEKD